MTIRPLSKELQQKALSELNEELSRIQEDLKHLRAWLGKQPHVYARTDDQWLLTFLRGSKFSLERTKEKLDMFYTVKSIATDFFANRDPFSPQVQEILNLGMFLPLQKSKTPDAPRIILIRMGESDPSKIKLTDIFRVNLMICDILLNEDDQFVVAGTEMLLDFTGVRVGHMTQLTPTVAKTTMTLLQEAYPIRSKGFHYFNLPSFFETLFSLVKPFMNQKFISRTRFYTTDDLNGLYATVPKSVLPKEYGGEGETVQELTGYWKKKVESYQDWFLEDANYCTNEARRPGKPKVNNDVFGIEGSFRKLNVD